MSSVINCFDKLVSKGYKVYKEKTERDITITGPISFIKVTGKGKTIYLFGDYHSNKYSCSNDSIDFSVFLQNTLEKYKKENKVVDIFMETIPWRIKKEDIKPKEEFKFNMEQISKLFSSVLHNDFYLNCLNKEIKDCFHRFHAVDIRFLNTNINNIHIEANRLFVKKKYLGKYSLSDRMNLWKLYYEILKITIEDIDNIKDKLKITKQINNIDIKEKVLLNMLFDGKIKNIFNQLDKIKKEMEDANKSGDNLKVLKNLEKYVDYFHFITINFFDFYTTARILRKFKDGTSPDNCIVIAGNNHVRNMVNMFEILRYKVETLDFKDINNKSELQCINMDKKYYNDLFG